MSQMPRLDAFDQELGREAVALLQGQRRRKLRIQTFVATALSAAVITALAWPWMSAGGGLRSEIQALLPTSRKAAGETSAEQVDRLVREIASLKKEMVDLTQARQQAQDRIAALESAEYEPRDHSAPIYWYSDLSALNYESPFPPRRRTTTSSAAPQ